MTGKEAADETDPRLPRGARVPRLVRLRALLRPSPHGYVARGLRLARGARRRTRKHEPLPLSRGGQRAAALRVRGLRGRRRHRSRGNLPRLLPEQRHRTHTLPRHRAVGAL